MNDRQRSCADSRPSGSNLTFESRKGFRWIDIEPDHVVQLGVAGPALDFVGADPVRTQQYDLGSPNRLHDKPKRPLQTSYAASVADTLFWPRRDHRCFLLPRPRIQDEPIDFACRIPDEGDPGVIFVVCGEFVA